MKIDNLIREVRYEGGELLYTPPDPYRIYERLGKLFLSARVISNVKLEKPIRIFDKALSGLLNYPACLEFIKWVHQEIPGAFWKFNTYIEGNKTQLKQSAKDTIVHNIWIDMRGKNNKLKQVKIDNNVLKNLDSGLTYLPDYERICKEVASWGEYRYNYGDIKEQKVTMGGDI